MGFFINVGGVRELVVLRSMLGWFFIILGCLRSLVFIFVDMEFVLFKRVGSEGLEWKVVMDLFDFLFFGGIEIGLVILFGFVRGVLIVFMDFVFEDCMVVEVFVLVGGFC